MFLIVFVGKRKRLCLSRLQATLRSTERFP
nr:MAG TPA: hypothetical protein [Caudoviricetes sp.]